MTDIRRFNGFELINSKESYKLSYEYKFYDIIPINYYDTEKINEVNWIPGSKVFILEKSYKDYDNDIIKNIKKLCLENNSSIMFDEIPLLGKLNEDDDDSILHSFFRKLISKFYFAKSDIQKETYLNNDLKIITNKKLGEFLNLNKNYLHGFLNSIFIDENQIEDTIYIFCKNEIGQSGLLLIYNTELQKYTIGETGEFPNKSYRSFNILLKQNIQDFKEGDVVTLKNDNIKRTVRFELNGKICCDWIDENLQPQQLLCDKEDIKLYNN